VIFLSPCSRVRRMNYGSRPSTQSLKQNLHHLPRHSLLKRSNTGNRKRRFLRESSDGVAQAQENEEEDTGEFEFHGSDYSCSRDQKQDLVVRVLSAEIRRRSLEASGGLFSLPSRVRNCKHIRLGQSNQVTTAEEGQIFRSFSYKTRGS
jgi:hypothetical protein